MLLGWIGFSKIKLINKIASDYIDGISAERTSSALSGEDCSSSASERDGDIKTKKGVEKLKKQKFCVYNSASCSKSYIYNQVDK